MLLESIDPLPYSERMAAVVGWARVAADRVAVCEDLRAGGPYERFLALTAAEVAGAADEVLAATADPQPSIRATALKAALRAGWLTEPELDRPATERRLIYRTLRAMEAPAVADALLPRVRERYGDDEAAALLPACSPELIRRLLPELDHAVRLTALARRHPDVLLDHVAARLEAAEPPHRGRIWDRTGHAVLRCPPARVLDLLERYAPRDRLPGPPVRYGVLAAHDPGRVAALLADPRREPLYPLHRAVVRRLVALPDDDLVPLGRRLRQHAGLAALLKALPPSRRGAFHDRVFEGIGPSERRPDTAIMELLPAVARAREATRMLGRRIVSSDEATTYTWSAYLPWPRARDALTGMLRSGDAEYRARGYQLLLDAARRSRDPRAVAEAIGLLDRLRNEQDPVRSVALTALARVAPLATAATADALTRLTIDAAEARDASWESRSALTRLAVDVLRLHFDEPGLREWALFAFERLSSGSVPALGRFDRELRRGQETLVFDRLRGWVEAGLDRGSYGPLFQLTRALGKRAWLLPDLQGLLRRAIDPENPDSVIEGATELWLADPRTRAARVAEVLDVDPSLVKIPLVWRTLCARRTDLLDLVLDRAPRGRFVRSGLRWVPSWPYHAERWLPRQHAAFVALQQRVINDEGSSQSRRTGAVAAAARIPVLGRAVALHYARDESVVIAEAALGALAWTDRPEEALTVLLGHAGDERARVALYAAGRAAAFVAPSRLPALLDGVLLGDAKVTSRKEVARLLGRYGPPESASTLLAAYTRDDQHRDVRAAIVATARGRLWSASSWTILEAGVRGRREESVAVLSVDPDEVPERYRARYAALVTAACHSADREVRQAAFTRLPGWTPWISGVTDMIIDRLTDLDEEFFPYSGDPLVGAVHADGLSEIWRRLAELDAGDDAGNAERDRPAWHRVDELSEAVVRWSNGQDRAVDRGPALAAARWLADRPPFLRQAVRMLVGLGRLGNLDEIADRTAHRPILAREASRDVESQASSREEEADPIRQLALAAELARHGDLARGLFAVAVCQRGFRHGWPPEWRDLMRSLRRHPDPDVRDAATAISMTW